MPGPESGWMDGNTTTKKQTIFRITPVLSRRMNICEKFLPAFATITSCPPFAHKKIGFRPGSPNLSLYSSKTKDRANMKSYHILVLLLSLFVLDADASPGTQEGGVCMVDGAFNVSCLATTKKGGMLADNAKQEEHQHARPRKFAQSPRVYKSAKEFGEEAVVSSSSWHRDSLKACFI
jgi:hypothetical protein